MTTPYFDTNDYESKPQNASGTGFNEWDLIKYKPDRDNKGLLAAYGIDSSTEWTYADVVANVAALPFLTADVDSENIYDNLKYLIEGVQTDMTETISVKIGKYCKNPIYVQWINENGAPEYELFSKKQDEGVDVESGKTVVNNFDTLHTASAREKTIGAQTRKTLGCYKYNIFIEQKDRFIDFKKSIAERDVLVFIKKFRADIESISDYSSTYPNTILLNIKGHKFENGDQTTILDTTSYNGTYDVIKIDDDNIAIAATYVSSEAGTMQRIVKESDWLRCQAIDASDDINNDNPVFNIEFEIKLPTGT